MGNCESCKNAWRNDSERNSFYCAKFCAYFGNVNECASYEQAHMTRGDKIRSMTNNVDLAIFLDSVRQDGWFEENRYPRTIFGFVDWLEEKEGEKLAGEKKVRDAAYERAMNLVEKDRNTSECEPSFFIAAEQIKDTGNLRPAGFVGHFNVSTGLDGE